jgi:glyoxalase family protein
MDLHLLPWDNQEVFQSTSQESSSVYEAQTSPIRERRSPSALDVGCFAQFGQTVDKKRALRGNCSIMSEKLQGLVKGLHHITLVTSNQELNRRFYTDVLGLRRVKYTVNQDDVFHRHLFYADEKGTTGSAITFFEWPELPNGLIGLGSPHHLAYSVSNYEAIPKWKAWLNLLKVSVTGPYSRDGRISLYLRDPDGVNIEITYPNDEIAPDYLKEQDKNLPTVPEISQDMRLVKFNHATPISYDAEETALFFDKLLALKNSFTKPNPDQPETVIAGIGNDDQPDFLRYIVSDDAARGFVGKGNVHHIALAVESDDDQRMIEARLNDLGIHNSGVIDRFWFHSLYFRDPDGNLLEIATKGPGYTRDEPLDKLGTSLILPPWEETQRSEIEKALEETDNNNHVTWPPKYPKVVSPPESIKIPKS